YILGEWEFYRLPFKVGEGVLIPRQDTETLVDTAARFLRERDAWARKTLDLCAGSGCIGIALAKTAAAEVTCVEKSRRAFGYLEENAALNHVSVRAVLGDALDENTVTGEYDLIVSNPPYLTESDMRSLQKEVSFEPEAALFGGTDGLDFYRGIIPIYARKLVSGGMIAVEIGMGQESAVSGIFRENGLDPRLEKDMRGIYRVVYGIK
ncbi:MAG: peptide chain release factor N(5)-glutamine methyltransferase, partial [Oscillospiraceae bacterium]|nr:peptide chain release factor N(5)-glutamine methyltransferase [Oscillospiraceae bacterium]